RRQAQIAGLDRLDDVADDRRVKRADEDLLRLWRAQVGHLLERRRRAIVLDPYRFHQANVRPTRPDAPQLVAQQRQALLHPLLRLERDLFDPHGTLFPSRDHREDNDVAPGPLRRSLAATGAILTRS